MFIKYTSIFVYFCKSLPFPPSLTLLFSSFSFFLFIFFGRHCCDKDTGVGRRVGGIFFFFFFYDWLAFFLEVLHQLYEQLCV